MNGQIGVTDKQISSIGLQSAGMVKGIVFDLSFDWLEALYDHASKMICLPTNISD